VLVDEVQEDTFAQEEDNTQKTQEKPRILGLGR
jgi:hypothetical protein